MNEKQKILAGYLTGKNFTDCVIELEGEYESIPDEIYDAYYTLSYEEKLQAFKVAIEKILLKR